MRNRFSWGELVEGAADAEAASVEDVGVDHGGLPVAVAEEFLDRADIVAGLEQVRREGVAERVARRALGDVGLADGAGDGALHGTLMQMAAHGEAGVGVDMSA